MSESGVKVQQGTTPKGPKMGTAPIVQRPDTRIDLSKESTHPEGRK